jgi:hypothetical protein
VGSRFTSRLLAVLAVLGLIAGPFALRVPPAGPDQIVAAAINGDSADMPDGMPCCPETHKKADCAKDCPFMAVCAGTVLPPANGVALAAPTALLALISPAQDAKLKGLAQGPPARPPKAWL